jgi:hypothetical protein
MTMQVQSPALTFPTGFCCNCGDTNCTTETQDTRVTRYFGIGGTETTFQLAVPVCAACRRTTRRRPARFFGRLLVFALLTAAWFLALVLLASPATWPLWVTDHRFAISTLLGFVTASVFYRLRRARPPMTSFYQPVRIKEASVHFAGVMGGPGQVVFMKLAFTNPDYLHAFMHANREAMEAGHVAAVRA